MRTVDIEGEGLLLSERAGVDPEIAAEAMSASSIGSPMLKARVPLLLDLPHQAWFDVALADKDGGTLLTYNVEAQIGGKLAQLGQRLINGSAKKLADEFFSNFAKAVQG